MARCPNSCDNGAVYDDCPTCERTGQVLGYDDDGQVTLMDCPTCGGSTTVSKTCPVCNGTGEA